MYKMLIYKSTDTRRITAFTRNLDIWNAEDLIYMLMQLFLWL